MFLYGLGVQFGKQFFAGLTGATGRRYNMLSLLALAAASLVTVIEMILMKVAPPMMAGLFAGAGTNAATMQAAMEAAKNSDPAVGFSVAYPFGLVGAILCLYFMQLFVKPNTTRGGIRSRIGDSGGGDPLVGSNRPNPWGADFSYTRRDKSPGRTSRP